MIDNPHDIPASEQTVTVNGVDIIVELRADGTVRVDVEYEENTTGDAKTVDIFLNGAPR